MVLDSGGYKKVEVDVERLRSKKKGIEYLLREATVGYKHRK